MNQQPILAIKELSVTFGQEPNVTTAVENVSIDIAPGESVALVGESGSGKSVTALSVMQLLPYPHAAHPKGSIMFEGEEMIAKEAEFMRHIRGKKIGMIFQEPMTSLNPLHTIGKQIAEAIDIHNEDNNIDIVARVVELLELVGVKKARSRLKNYPHQLSGGQRQRVMIAIALANNPDLLIADEPTTALDVTIQAQVLDLIKSLQTRLGMTLLLITHDLNIVRKMSDRVYVMKLGRVVEQGNVNDVFYHPKHPYTQHLLASQPTGHPDPTPEKTNAVIEANHIRVWFPIKRGFLQRTVDHIKAVDDISLVVHQGETVGLVGESGSGKTTLGMALLKLTSAKGEIIFAGKNFHDLDYKQTRALRKDIQIVFQDPYGSLSPRMSIGEIIGEGLRVHYKDLDANGRDDLVVQAMEEVGMDAATRHRYPHEFSGGQRQRIAVARAIVLKPSFIVLDEPTSALDMSVQAQIVSLLKELQRRHNLAYLFISHDLKVVRALSHKIIVMRDGLVVESGATEDVFERPQQAYTKELIKAAFAMEAN